VELHAVRPSELPTLGAPAGAAPAAPPSELAAAPPSELAAAPRPSGQSTDAPGTVRRRPGAEGPIVLGRYRLLRRLGSGAFATVWAARDERLERDVAVKILDRERILPGRFEREARAAARLQHPAIVTLYEAAVDDDGACLVSELVRGATLEALALKGSLSDRAILEVGLALCGALEHAHAAGVVHRDVKPSNILVPRRPHGPEQAAKLTDFGVAQLVGGDSLTRTGEVIGTAAYMAPEQAEGREAGPAADLYALALVLYEALAGVNPATAVPHGARRLAAHLPPLRRQRRDLPRELAAGIDLALRPRPRERGTIGELREALRVSLPQVGERSGPVGPAWAPPPLSTLRTKVARGDPEVGEEQARSRAAEQPPSRAAEQPVPPPRWAPRAAAALAAAGTALWLGAHLLAALALPGAILGLGAAVAVLLLPRLGWLALLAVACGLGAAEGSAGAALLVAFAGLLAAVVNPRRAWSWPLPAGAVALALIGLGGAWPALAARLGARAWTRAALGALGWLWLACASTIGGFGLYLRLPAGLPSPQAWLGSPSLAIHDVLPALLAPGLLAVAPLWAAAAASLPWLARGGSPRARLARVLAWAAVLALGTALLAGAAWRPSAGAIAAGALAAGALAGGALAVRTLAAGGPALARRRSQGARKAETPGI
jgi:serine/threonine protein kinase